MIESLNVNPAHVTPTPGGLSDSQQVSHGGAAAYLEKHECHEQGKVRHVKEISKDAS